MAKESKNNTSGISCFGIYLSESMYAEANKFYFANFDAYKLVPATEAGLGNVESPSAANRKLLEDGRIVIQKNGRKYTTTGVEIK